MTQYLAVTNDWHSGHRLGLMNPQVELHREDELGNIKPYQPQPTASQQYLWELHTRHVQEVERIAKGNDITLLLNGDLTQGNKHSGHWVSTRISDQILIAVANTIPWFALPNLKHCRIAKGTEAHNFGEGSSEFIIQELLQRTYPSVDTQIVSHGLLTVNDVVFDYAHHGPPPGSRNWLRGNEARYYLRDLMDREILSHRRPPDVVLRAHYHAPVHEVLEEGGYTSELFVVPSYCMADDYAQKSNRSLETITHGLVLFECDNGKFDYERLYATLDTRTVETIDG